jgi:hypothetical protein
MVLVWLFYPETAGRSLEEVEDVFTSQVMGAQVEQSPVAETTVVGTAPRSQIRRKGLHPLSMHPTYDNMSITSDSSGSEKGIEVREV